MMKSFRNSKTLEENYKIQDNLKFKKMGSTLDYQNTRFHLDLEINSAKGEEEEG